MKEDSSYEFKNDNHEFIDDNNVLIYKKNYKNQWIVEHKRNIGGKLVLINKFNTGKAYNTKVFQNFKLIDHFLILDFNQKNERTNYVYDCFNDNIIIDAGIWNQIVDKDYVTNIDYYHDYNCFLGLFDLEVMRLIGYRSIITKERNEVDCSKNDGTYFGFINFDGSLRDNKIFKGNNIDEINQIYNLNNHETLNDFKIKQYNLLVDEVEKNMKHYMDNLYKNGSPYYERDVIKVLRKKN